MRGERKTGNREQGTGNREVRGRGRGSRSAVVSASLKLAALVLALCAVGGEASAAPSTYSEQGNGSKVLYLLLQDLGYQTVRVFDVEDLDPSAHALVTLGSAEGREGERILSWLKPGRALVIAPPLVEDEGYCKEVRIGSLKVQRRGRVAFEKTDEKTQHVDLKLRESACTLVAPSTATVLAGTTDRTLAFEHAAEAGRMLVLAHDDMLVNANLDSDDIAVLLRRWLSTHVPDKGKVVFLETRAGGQLWEMLRRANLVALLLHGLIFLLLLYWMLAPRFGDPLPGAVATRRAFAQHAAALGHLYQRRGASAYLLKQLYDRFLARLVGRVTKSGAAGTSAHTPVRDARQNRARLATLVSTRTGRDPASVESTLAQVEYTVGSPDVVDPKEAQRHFRLAQSLAALQRGSTVTGGKRGRKRIR